MRHECPLIRIYMEVIILGVNTLYSVFCFLKTLSPMQVHVWLVHSKNYIILTKTFIMYVVGPCKFYYNSMTAVLGCAVAM